MFNLEEELKNLPDSPGVYIMKNIDSKIIYVGKAISLKNRVRQYFQSSRNHSPKVIAMVKNIASFEYILVNSEMEALILECNLIKKHRPRYNISLKDDKQYPYLKITVNEDYPRLIVTRNLIRDGGKYFGPYTDVGALRDTIKTIRRIYPVRSCSREVAFGKKAGKPCLNYHIKRCLAPCTGNVKKEDYLDIVGDIILLLSGKHTEIIATLKKRMEEAAEELNFELAADIRDKIQSIIKIQEKQRIIAPLKSDSDVIAAVKREEGTAIEVFYVREGKLSGRDSFYFDDIEEDVETTISQFIIQLYSEREYVPIEIFISHEPLNISELEDFLSKKRGSRVFLKVPKKGEKRELIKLAQKNAENSIELIKLKIERESMDREGVLLELSRLLNIDYLIDRIEAFDISNLQGTDPVASMVVFKGSKPDKKEYRRFKIKTITGPDDYSSMAEVIKRRFERGLRESYKENNLGEISIKEDKKSIEYKDSNSFKNKEKFSNFPDLILVDGGKGQVSAAKNILNELNLDIPICGMVKDDKHRSRGLIFEGNEIDLKGTNVFKLITRIQDEAHRFAIEYHRRLRTKTSLSSALDEIKGVGEKRKKALLNHFRTIDNIKEAELDELLKVEGINRGIAREIINYFKNKSEG